MLTCRPPKEAMRAFIVGNGPSLNWTPLDSLAGEVTYGFNKVYLLLDRVKWRPTYWIIADLSASDYWPMTEVFTHGSKYLLRAEFQETTLKHLNEAKADFEWISRCNQHDHMNCLSDGVPTSWHLPTYCRFGGGLFIAIQHAVMQGYNPLYLLGADLYTEPELDGREWVDINHFDPTYGFRMPKQYGDYNRVNKTLLLAHKNALDGCHERGVEIYNATYGGQLEIYPRVRLEDVLDQKAA